MNKPILSSQTNDTFVLHGKRYLVGRVISNGKAGPVITPKIEEIDLAKNHTTDQTDPEGAKNYSGPIIFYQYEGKLIVLVGHEHALRILEKAQSENLAVLSLKGHLLTKHSLKRCVEDTNQQQTQRIIEEQIRGDDLNTRYENQRAGRFSNSNPNPGRYDRDRFQRS